MLVRSLMECEEIVAGDNTLLRELLHPDKQSIDLRYSFAVARVAAGKSSSPHRLRTSEVYYLLQGRGRMHIDNESREVAPGDAVYIPPNATQHIDSLGPDELIFVCIVDPAWRAEDEIVEPALRAENEIVQPASRAEDGIVEPSGRV